MGLDINTIVEMYRDGKIKEVMDAVRADPSLLKCQEEFGDTLLIKAASKGDKEMVSSLLAMGASATIDGPCYYSPLIEAIEFESPHTLEIAQLLIQHGADVNTKSYRGNSALHQAVRAESEEIAEFLLKNGADINIRGPEDEETPLWCAAIKGSEKMVHYLLDHGANPWLRETILGTPLEISRRRAADSEGHRNIIKLLEECMNRQANEAVIHNDLGRHGFNPNIIDLYLYGKTKEVMEAIRKDPSLVKFRDEFGGTLLNHAAAHGDKDSVAELLALGANADIDDPQHPIPLISAIQSAGSPHTFEILKLLLQYGANVNTKNQWDQSAIYYALHIDFPEMVEFLLKNGADMNILSDKNKQSLLGVAAARGREEMVRFALDLGADPRLEYTGIGTTPIGVAREYATKKKSQSHLNIVKILEERIEQLKFEEQAGKKE